MNYKLSSINVIIDRNGRMQYTFTYITYYDPNNYNRIDSLDSENQYFNWIDIDKIDSIDLKSLFVKELIKSDSNELRHFVEYVE